MLYRRIPKEKGSKIDLNQLRDFHSTDFYYSKQFEGAELATEIDKLKELKSILSKELPPERYNGIINLIYIFRNPKATSEEIENSLVMCHYKKILYIFELWLRTWVRNIHLNFNLAPF